MPLTSEERLFERFRRKGDAGSLAKVFDRVAPALMRIGLHLTRDRHVAEDLVQHTFLIAIEKASDWDPGRGLFPWLVGILTNRARLHHRDVRRQPDTTRLVGQQIEAPLEAAATRELELAVESAIEDLGDTYRPVLHLHLFHGLNAKEIATALGRPAGSVRTQLVRGLERLRRALPVGLGVGATVAATATAAVRRRVLTATTPKLTAGAVGAASLMLGGPLMKKWLLLVPIALLGMLILWQGTETAHTPTPEGASPSPATESATLPDDERTEGDRSEEVPSVERREERSEQVPDPTTGRLSVQVRFANEELSPVGIWVRMLPEPWVRGGARFGGRADAEGHVHFEGIPAGRWRVQAETGWTDPQVIVEIEPGGEHQQALTIDVVVPIRVLVVDQDRQPVPDAEIWVCRQRPGRVWPMEVTTRLAAHTDSSGRALVAAGNESRVGARKPGYASSATIQGKVAGGEEALLMLTPGPGGVRGVVVDDDGAPVPGADVYLTAGRFGQREVARAADGRTSEAPPSLYTAAAQDGSFDISALRPGRYRLFAISRGVLDVERDVEVRAFETTPVRIEMRKSIPVKVRTTRTDGTPIPGLLVFGRDLDGNLVGGGSITDRNGVLIFAAPRSGYHIEVKREEEEGLVAERRSTAPLTDAVEVDIVIDEHLIVRGRLVDEGGEPVAGWRVVAVPDTASESDVNRALAFAFDADSKADGSFEIWGELDQPLQVAARGNDWRDMLVRRGIPVGTDGLEVVVPTGKLPRSVLIGRVVDEFGSVVTDASARPLKLDDAPIDCTDGQLRIEGLRHGKQSFHIAAPGFGRRRLELDIQDVRTDVGDIVLRRAVQLRVRPVFPEDTEWLGTLPRAWIQTPDGRYLWPEPTSVIEAGSRVFNDLPPGHYVLKPHLEEQIAAEPVPFELIAGTPIEIDWNVRVGRKRVVIFDPGADRPAPPDSMLTIRMVDADDRVAVNKQVKSWRGKWVLRHTFVPGSYRVTGMNGDRHAFEGTFEVSLDDPSGEEAAMVEIPAKR